LIRAPGAGGHRRGGPYRAATGVGSLFEVVGAGDPVAAQAMEAGAHVLGCGVDFEGLDAVGAGDEFVPGGDGGLGVAAAQVYFAEVGQDDGAGAFAVEAVDVEGVVEVGAGFVEFAEAGEDHAGFVGPAADAVVAGPGGARGGGGGAFDPGL
jgi:hypothetical protein